VRRASEILLIESVDDVPLEWRLLMDLMAVIHEWFYLVHTERFLRSAFHCAPELQLVEEVGSSTDDTNGQQTQASSQPGKDASSSRRSHSYWGRLPRVRELRAVVLKVFASYDVSGTCGNAAGRERVLHHGLRRLPLGSAQMGRVYKAAVGC